MHSCVSQSSAVVEAKQLFIDSRELAVRMGRSERYVAHLVERKLIPYYRLPGSVAPRIHRITVDGRVIERQGRAGQLMFIWDRVMDSLAKYEITPETSPIYRMRRPRSDSRSAA